MSRARPLHASRTICHMTCTICHMTSGSTVQVYSYVEVRPSLKRVATLGNPVDRALINTYDTVDEWLHGEVTPHTPDLCTILLVGCAPIWSSWNWQNPLG